MPKKGYKQTEKHKERIRDFRIGKKHSDETKDKMRKRMIGNSFSKGRKLSQKEIEERRIRMIGNTRRLGIKHTKETRDKQSKALLGNKSPNWKGGINPINDTIRKSLEYKLWHDACLERDNFTCQISGKKGGKLVVHHIKNFADYPELRTSIENGITITKKLHKLFHHIYGVKNNTREQLEEFRKNYEY